MSSITYEHPLSERIRTLLRMEHLFKQIDHFHQEHSVWDSRMVLHTLFELLDLLSRNDIRTEIIKEIDRSLQTLTPLLTNPNIDNNQLQAIIDKLQQASGGLRKMGGHPGQSLRDEPFLTTIRQRSTIPGGTCDFDLPGYHQWLSQPIELRHPDQQQWINELTPLKHAISLLLDLIRDSTLPKPLIAMKGSYQQQLDTTTAYQMIRIILPTEAPFYAEVSGSKHRISIRFLARDSHHNIRMVDDDIAFSMALSIL